MWESYNEASVSDNDALCREFQGNQKPFQNNIISLEE